MNTLKQPTQKQMIQIAECYANKSKNARQRKLQFGISLLTFVNIKLQTHCAYSGLPFTEKDELSLERIDNNLGYIDGNVIPVIRRLNNLRNDHTLETIDGAIDKCKKSIETKELHIGGLKAKAASLQSDLNSLEALPSEYTETVKKFVVPPKKLKTWVNLSNRADKAAEKLKMRRTLIKQAQSFVDGTSARKLKASKIKVQENLLKVHKEKLPQEEKNDRIFGKALRDLLVTFETVERSVVRQKDQTEILALRKQIEDIQKHIVLTLSNVDAIKAEIEDFETIKAGLQKFTNLSDSDRMKLNAGLPLEYSTLKAYKHTIASRCVAVSF